MSARQVDQAIGSALETLGRVAEEFRDQRRYDDMRAVEEAANELRRARWHEKENYFRADVYGEFMDRLGMQEWHPDDGDSRCQVCTRPNPVWYTHNDAWNRIMRDTGEEDRTGILCPTCFMLKAPEVVWSIQVRPVQLGVVRT